MSNAVYSDVFITFTPCGPIIVPVQSVKVWSSPKESEEEVPLARPYEIMLSPIPFSPFSSSSNNLKGRGTKEFSDQYDTHRLDHHFFFLHVSWDHICSINKYVRDLFFLRKSFLLIADIILLRCYMTHTLLIDYIIKTYANK